MKASGNKLMAITRELWAEWQQTKASWRDARAAEFERRFGGLWKDSTISYAVQHYFAHGGKDALIVRVINGGAKATITLPPESGSGDLVLEAPDGPGREIQAQALRPARRGSR